MSRTVTVTLTLPDKTIQRLEQTAAGTHRTLEKVITESLVTQIEQQAIDEQPAPLANCTDKQLWAMVYRMLSPKQKSCYDILTDKLEDSLAFSPEENEYQALNNLIMDHLLLRSEALALLKERGHDVSQFFKQAE